MIILIYHNESSQLRPFSNLSRVPSGHLTREVYHTNPMGGRPPGRPQLSWQMYTSAMAEERLGIPELELAKAAREREAWSQILELLPSQPNPGVSGRRSKYISIDMDGLCIFAYDVKLGYS